MQDGVVRKELLDLVREMISQKKRTLGKRPTYIQVAQHWYCAACRALGRTVWAEMS
jgi:hypothetical protein